MVLNSRWAAIAWLSVASLIWGSTFPLIRVGVEHSTPLVLVISRFLVAFVLVLPVWYFLEFRNKTLRHVVPQLLWLLPLGVLNGLGFITQTLGLKTVESARAGFLTGFYVILVPLMVPLFGLGFPRWVDGLACVVALGGMILLLHPEGSFHLASGDLWILSSAFLFAVGIVYLQWLYKRLEVGVVSPLFAQVFATLLLLSPWWKELPSSGAWISGTWLAVVLFLGGVATLGPFWIQFRFQREVTAPQAALVFSLEPVFAAALAWWWIGESMTLPEILGGVLVLLAAIAPELMRRSR